MDGPAWFDALFVPLPEGTETFHAYPCAHCGADGDSRGVCCDAWTEVRCPGCNDAMVDVRQPGEGPLTMVTCPDCEEG